MLNLLLLACVWYVCYDIICVLLVLRATLSFSPLSLSLSPLTIGVPFAVPIRTAVTFGALSCKQVIIIHYSEDIVNIQTRTTHTTRRQQREQKQKRQADKERKEGVQQTECQRRFCLWDEIVANSCTRQQVHKWYTDCTYQIHCSRTHRFTAAVHDTRYQITYPVWYDTSCIDGIIRIQRQAATTNTHAT